MSVTKTELAIVPSRTVSCSTTRTASQHLRVLKDAGLVRGRVDGRRRLYRVDLQGLERLRRELDALWGPALQALKDAAENEDRP